MATNVLSCLHVPRPTLILKGRQRVLKQGRHCDSVPPSPLHICRIHWIFSAHGSSSNSFSTKILHVIMHLLWWFPAISLWWHVSLWCCLLLLLRLLLWPVTRYILLHPSWTCHGVWRLSCHTALAININLLYLFYGS